MTMKPNDIKLKPNQAWMKTDSSVLIMNLPETVFVPGEEHKEEVKPIINIVKKEKQDSYELF